MKRFAPLTLIAALTISGAAFGQTGDMKGMDMKQGCKDMNDMTDMKGMDMPACKEMKKEKTSDSQAQGTPKKGMVHKTSAVVKAVDLANSKVTLAHGQVKTLNWPPMTMAFTVKDKRFFDKLVVGNTVNVELVKEGSGFVVTAVK
jgi:Cu(I)/Ag(I) efflux system protein CusF